MNAKRIVFPGFSSIAASLIVVAMAAVSLPSGAAAEASGVSPDEALSKLKAGNQRFVSGKLAVKKFAKERADLVKGQQPYAILLSCSDSRVPPEEVFDESLGKLFVVRVAGNVADPVVLGSVEYAAEHLGARLVMVLGHDSCGAVTATIAGGHVPPNIAELVKHIMPAVRKAQALKMDPIGTLKAAIEENVRLQMAEADAKSEVLHEMVEKKALRIVGAVYSLQSGNVEMLSSAAAR